jgi:hypothetical protein
LISEFLAAMAIFTTFRMTADDEAVLPALLKLGVIETSKSAMESPIFQFCVARIRLMGALYFRGAGGHLSFD